MDQIQIVVAKEVSTKDSSKYICDCSEYKLNYFAIRVQNWASELLLSNQKAISWIWLNQN